MVNFKVKSKAVALKIHEIALRASGMARRYGIDYPLMDADMDITAVHCNGNPLRLDDLLAADEFNFAHDILGIRKHIDRETGELMDHFCPRFSA